MKNLSNPFCYIAYASGFSLGNYIASRWPKDVARNGPDSGDDQSRSVKSGQSLTEKDYGVTTVQGQGLSSRQTRVYYRTAPAFG